jgi:hypothetical protein
VLASLAPGTTCEDRGTTLESLPVDGGMWRASNKSTEILECDNEEACTPPSCEDKTEQIKEQTGGLVEDCSYYESWCEDDSPMVNSATSPYPEGWLATHCAKTCGLCEVEAGSSDVMCAEFHTGPLCELCEEGYAMAGGVCVGCSGDGGTGKVWGALTLVGLIGVLLGICGYTVKNANEEKAKELEDRGKGLKKKWGVPAKLFVQYVCCAMPVFTMCKLTLDLI